MTRKSSATVIAVLALAIAAVSLACTLFLLGRLRTAEAMLDPFRPLLADAVNDDGSIRTEIRIPAGTPINLDIPVDERIQVRVDTDIPVDTRVVVPVRSALGNYDIPVPIQTTVPLEATVPVHLRQTFQLRTFTPSDIVIPIEVDAP